MPAGTDTPQPAPTYGALDRDVIRRVVRSNIEQIRSCYNKGLERNNELAGRVTVQFTIGPSGSVSKAVVSDWEVQDERVRTCIVESTKTWTFPKPNPTGNVTVTYPFVLKPGEASSPGNDPPVAE